MGSAGTMCRGSIEGYGCDEGLMCVTPEDAPPGAIGVCQKVVGAGEACSPTVAPEFQVHCEAGLTCVTPPGMLGASGMCQKVVGAGEACNPTVAPEFQVHCETGLICLSPPGMLGASGVCQAPVPQTACKWHRECKSTEFCAAGEDVCKHCGFCTNRDDPGACPIKCRSFPVFTTPLTTKPTESTTSS